MQISSISGYCTPKTCYIKKNNFQNNPSFGKIDWKSEEDIKKAEAKNVSRELNNEINDFFYRMHNFETVAKTSAKLAKDLGKTAYIKAKEKNFKNVGNVRINNLPSNVACVDFTDSRLISIVMPNDSWEFRYSKNSSSLTQIRGVHKHNDFTYRLYVTPEITKYEKEDEYKKIVKRYTKYSDKCIYEEPDSEFSRKKGIIKGLKKTFQKEEDNYINGITTTTYEKNLFSKKWEAKE